MTQKDKELLLNDLCARIPYDVILGTTDDDGSLPNEWRIMHYNAITEDFKLDNCYKNADQSIDVGYIRPYLFPLSSMTEEQMDKVEEILMGYDPKIIFDFMADGDIIFKKGNISIKAFIELTQYFDKEMLDYRGLIPMGLAEDCTNLNIY